MRKVLIVNDSKFESIVIKDILNSMGYDARVSDEYDAMAYVKSFNPDIMLVNYIMKEIRGDQLISIVKLKDSRIKCLLCSSSPIDIDRLENKKIDSFIITPVSKKKLEDAFNKLEYPGNGDDGRNTIDSIRSKLSDKSFCYSCGHKTEGLFAFCPYCGVKL